MQYESKKNIRNQKYFDILGYHGNYQVAKDSAAVLEYISKADENPLKYGMFVSNNQKDLQKRAKENRNIIDKDIVNLIQDGDIHISNIEKIKKAKELYNIVSKHVPDTLHRECYWIYGETGIGKSMYVRSTYPSCYYKPQNEWWDGYNAQPVVCMDDVDDSKMGYYLKIWGDRYSFSAQVKGSTVVPGYTVFIVTSNYRIDELFPDPKVSAPLKRRFKEVTIKGGCLFDESAPIPDDMDELALKELF